MNKKAFLLGFFSIGGQILILRELIASFNGDELFIGTALFGWMLSVALGAYFGGYRRRPFKSNILLIAGAAILPISILSTRLSPLILCDIVGEIIPFGTAAIASIILAFPTGFFSGLLFPSLTREGHRTAASISRVYLFEGIGAFIGGIIITVLAGPIFSTLALAVALAILILILNFISFDGKAILPAIFLTMVLMLAAKFGIPLLDKYIEGRRYESFQIHGSFDTHYGHQTIISRDSTTILLTDNKVEAVYPDWETAENILIPPLIYKPDAKNILILGRTEFGLSQIAVFFPEAKFTSLDPRVSLTGELKKCFSFGENIDAVTDDPLSYLGGSEILTKYDLIILIPGSPDNYKSSRLLATSFLNRAKKALEKDGLLFIPTAYDTDRFISLQKQKVLATINRTLEQSFRAVNIWPGTFTLFFASNDSILNFSYETIVNRIDSLPYKPQFISRDYLINRLDSLKISRLRDAVKDDGYVNNLVSPHLLYQQALLTSSTNNMDKTISGAVFQTAYPAATAPIIVALFFILSIVPHQRRRIFGLYLYFTTGLFSLSAELISFYLYQSVAGSLYSDIGLLIGVFMLGLALGSYVAIKSGAERLEYPSLLLLLTSIILLFVTYSRVSQSILLYYHMLFLLTIAIASGSLFVAATYRYYFGRARSNQGVGYACEIIGSAIGALFVMTILLPLLGLTGLLISMIIFVLLGLLGAYMTE